MQQFSQDFIDFLISCEKYVVNPPKKSLETNGSHERNQMSLSSLDDKHAFHVFMRKNVFFAENFTIGLSYVLIGQNRPICILRCNGPHGDHINDWQGDQHFFGYHIHKATEENIALGLKSEKFAEQTTEYSTFDDAIAYFLTFCNIRNAEKYFPSIHQSRMKPLF